MSTETLRAWRDARNALRYLCQGGDPPPPAQAVGSGLANATLVITHNEVCHQHGTGILVRRLFGHAPAVVHVRGQSHYGSNAFGAAEYVVPPLAHEASRSRFALHGALAEQLRPHDIRRQVCIPFDAHDVQLALAAHDLFGGPFCLYFMDDQNVHGSGIPDGLMQEALRRADLVLTISPEMRDAYESKFGVKCWILPPTIDDSLVPPPAAARLLARGLLVGNIWGEEYLDQLLACLGPSGLGLDWFCNGSPNFERHSPEDIQRGGLWLRQYLPEQDLVRRSAVYPFAVVLGGCPESLHAMRWLSAFSLPSRLVFLAGCCGIPILALGSAGTPVANFVERFEIGVVARPEAGSLREAAARLAEPAAQERFRANARALRPLFRVEGIDEWLWNSTAAGSPVDDRFERAFARRPDNFTPWLEPPVSEDVFWQFHDVHLAVRRLKHLGFAPRFVVDVGCSTGVWSHSIRPLFPDAHFVLVDPLLAHYRRLNAWYFETNPDFDTVETALGDEPKRIEIHVSDDLYGTSILPPTDARTYHRLEVPLRTLDDVMAERPWSGDGLLKIDVQSAEHLVLAGGRRCLSRFEFVILELTLDEVGVGKTFLEMQLLMNSLGYDYHDDAGGWRCPRTGRLVQKDVVFRRRAAAVEGGA